MEFRHAFCANKIMRDKIVFFLILLLLCRFAYRDWPLFDENLKLLVNEFNTEWPFGTDNYDKPFSSYQILFMFWFWGLFTIKWVYTFIMKYILVTSIHIQIILTHAKYPRHLSYFSNFGGTLVLKLWKYEKYIPGVPKNSIPKIKVFYKKSWSGIKPKPYCLNTL